MSDYVIRSGSWVLLATEAKMVRTDVFIQEQNIAEHDEWDTEDDTSLHFVMYDQQQAIATARLLKNNSIGRVAVLKNYRGQGIGQQLMQYIIMVAATEQRAFLKLSAQVHAIGFYEKLGFQVKGERYLDCGIPHVDMFLMT
ncbi:MULTISPECIES: GNAT family N-acetyltransferase [Acinetobacter]|uniref:GNAT family N-acetyltransferase n=1 Tax=Acinetobacter piscicola TaxID=2006115 RepID=A0A7S6VY94_9GAMM|nr:MULTISPECIES: GNAT family N-acetyltransferase [Acinetobacter]QOW47129.1 GNAT family N-acetyltransferase [Acinetobacter piscicola]